MWHMKFVKFTLAAWLATGFPQLSVAQNTTPIVNGDWVMVRSPQEASPGIPFEIQLEVKEYKEKTQVGLDLHWMRKDGSYGGFLAMGGRQDVDKAGPLTFSPKFGNPEGMAIIAPIVFLSPDGSWEKRTHVFNAPAISVKIDGAALNNIRPQNLTYKKSWISIAPPDPTRTYSEGDEFEVEVEYSLDASETWGEGTSLVLNPLGPWIDNPDGKYTNTRFHASYPGIHTRAIKVAPGRGVQKFRYKVGKLFRYNSLLLVATFKDADGNNWPWEVRESGPRLKASSKYFELTTGKPGNLFSYEEPVQLQLNFKAGSSKGVAKTLKYKIVNVSGQEIAASEVPFASGAPGETTKLTLPIKARGTFLIETEVEGWEKQELFIARIPDVRAQIGNAKTPFGATNLRTEAESQIARMLGFSYSRQFFTWNTVQPAPNVWKFDQWDRILRVNKQHNIDPWLCIYAPPAWVQSGAPVNVGYEPFPFDEAAWKQSIETMTQRWKNTIWGWEWLNEIVPGNQSKNPVADYLRFTQIGSQMVKKIDPRLQIQLAGGLWPRNFRSDLLKAGVGQYVDVLPVHYGDMGSVLEAHDDLNSAGLKLPVWDNESSSGLSVWDMPLREAIQVKSQSQWVLSHWPDELVAGAKRVVMFGGWADPAGNWTYLLDESTPRPVAATIAVLSSKLAGATPLGKFFRPGGGVFHLFEKSGKPILIAASATSQSTSLPIGAEKITVTDYQGNATIMAAPKGQLSLRVDPMPVFIEGGDLQVLKSQLTLAVGENKQPVEYARVVAIASDKIKIPVRLRNPYNRPLRASLSINGSKNWQTVAQKHVVPAGRELTVDVVATPPLGATAGDFAMQASLQFDNEKLPALQKPFGLTLISPDQVGNLLLNGDFEQAGSAEQVAASWSMGKFARRTASGGGLGLGNHVLRYENTGDWDSSTQTLKATPGQSYLYTAWVWNQNMQAGSNITHQKTDGTKQDFYIPQVFDAGMNSASWKLLFTRTNTPPNLREIAFTPVVNGSGWALFDNMRVTLYEGTHYAAEVHQAQGARTIDGKLDDWSQKCPIPLLVENQLSIINQGYKWAPDNLSGVAYLEWDAKGLYFAAEVRDDKQVALSSGESTLSGDSIALAIHPANRSEGKDDKAFVYYLSAASPGGGSGAHTLYRPATRSGGLSSGHLAKDSSVYEFSVQRQETLTTYELRIPWSELGGITAGFGTKFGLSLQLNDNDGAGRVASMTWGDGLQPTWHPRNFGVSTLVNR
jgi:hypothetical protein